MEMNLDIFKKCAVIDSLMQGQGKQKLYKIDINQVINRIRIDSSLRNLLQSKRYLNYNFDKMKEEVIRFSESIMDGLTKNEIRAIDQFFEGKQFAPDLIDDAGLFHEDLPNHPSIQWSIQQMR